MIIEVKTDGTLTDFGVAVKTDKQMRAPGTPDVSRERRSLSSGGSE